MKKHWATTKFPGVLLAGVVLVLCLAEAGVLTHHDVKPAGTFRTTDLIVDPYDLACHAPGIGNPKRL